jgi:hypothetical protein
VSVLLPDDVTRERAITVLKWLAKGRSIQLTAELSGETKAAVAAVLDICPDPSPRGIRSVLDELERPGRSRPAPVHGPIPELTPATPRPVNEGRPLAVSVDVQPGPHAAAAAGGVVPAGTPLLIEPGPPELIVRPLPGVSVGPNIPPITTTSSVILDPLPGDPVRDDVDRLVERIQQLRPTEPDPGPDPAAAPAPDEVREIGCAVCRQQITYRRGGVHQALSEHYTAAQHRPGPR